MGAEHYSGHTPLWIYTSVIRDQGLGLGKVVENVFLSNPSEVSRIVPLAVWV